MQIHSKILLLLIRGYQLFLSPFIGNECRFQPTCSNYAQDALKVYGFWPGMWYICRRILRCNPWGGSGFDPIIKKDGLK